MYRPGPNSVDIIKHFEGDPRLRARLCEGGKFELGWGSTYLPDGSAVTQSMTCTPEQAEIYFQHCQQNETKPVWDRLEFTPNQFQIDALASFAYRVGGSALASTAEDSSTSGILRHMNNGRWEEACIGMTVWTANTSVGPSKIQLDSGRYNDIIMFDGSGRALWKGEDGLPCKYVQRLRGSLRRVLAEGLLSLGLNWQEACAYDAVFLRTRRVWNERRRRWEDRVISKTEFRDVLQIARGDTLVALPPASEEVRNYHYEDSEIFDEEAEGVVTLPPPIEHVEEEALPEPEAPVVAREAPAPAQKPAKEPPGPYKHYDPQAEPKSMTLSKRFYGLWLVFSGWVMALFEGLANIPATEQISKISPWQVDNPWTILVILMAGFLVYYWGQTTAKRPTK